MFKKKIEPNDSLQHIFDYINNCNVILTWKELIEMSIDYECYKELYLNHVIIRYLLEEHNEAINNGKIEELKSINYI